MGAQNSSRRRYFKVLEARRNVSTIIKATDSSILVELVEKKSQFLLVQYNAFTYRQIRVLRQYTSYLPSTFLQDSNLLLCVTEKSIYITLFNRCKTQILVSTLLGNVYVRTIASITTFMCSTRVALVDNFLVLKSTVKGVFQV